MKINFWGHVLTICNSEKEFENKFDFLWKDYFISGTKENGRWNGVIEYHDKCLCKVFDIKKLSDFIQGCFDVISIDIDEKEKQLAEYQKQLEPYNVYLGTKQDKKLPTINDVISNMRELTPEENKSISDYVDSISKKTGINVFDDKTIVDRLEEYVTYLDEQIVIEEKYSSTEFSDRVKNPQSCCVLRNVRNALTNILNGKDFNCL